MIFQTVNGTLKTLKTIIKLDLMWAPLDIFVWYMVMTLRIP